MMRNLLIILGLILSVVGCKQNTDAESGNSVQYSKPFDCYFFFIPDCPASRADLVEVMQIRNSFSDSLLNIVAILSDPDPEDSVLEATIEQYSFTIPIVYDSTLTHAQKFGATTTPQVFLLDQNQQLIYSGQISDYYYSYGKHKARIKNHYLSDAIQNASKNQPINPSKTSPIGCKINFDL